MKTTKVHARAPASQPLRRVLTDYLPVAALWTGKNPPYPSEQSARWALRQHRQLLADAGALALDRGRLVVQPELFVRVIEQEAIRAIQKRADAAARRAA